MYRCANDMSRAQLLRIHGYINPSHVLACSQANCSTAPVGLRNGTVLQVRYYWATDTCIDIKFILDFKSCKTLKPA
jgi:hypothetical protein